MTKILLIGSVILVSGFGNFDFNSHKDADQIPNVEQVSYSPIPNSGGGIDAEGNALIIIH